MHDFRGTLRGEFLIPQNKISSHIFKIAYTERIQAGRSSVTSDARYFIVKIKCHYDFIIVLWANSYFKCITQKSLKRGIVGLCKSYFENMRADFVLRYQKLTSQSTPENYLKSCICRYEKKNILRNNIS